jgi:hypothetical protein
MNTAADQTPSTTKPSRGRRTSARSKRTVKAKPSNVKPSAVVDGNAATLNSTGSAYTFE